VALRLERMNRGRRTHRAEREARAQALAEALSGMPLTDLVRGVTTRQWTVAVMHLGGYEMVEIARSIGYSKVDVVARILKHPTVKRLIELVRDAQLERVLQGTFGVRAQAKAAAPEAMAHVIELAGARKGSDGTRVGRAKRDSDALRASELVLTVSGDKIERQETLHVHLFEQMSDQELEALAVKGEVPERLKGAAGLLVGTVE
jgi:hypothetical protein